MTNNYIIDVGACYTGNVTKDFRRNNNLHNIPIIFIEPEISSFNSLKTEYDYDIKLPICISTYDGITKFNLYREGTHSILDINLKDVNKFIDGYTGINSTEELWVKNTIDVPCNRLETIIKNYNINIIELLKIDTQGFDFEVIKSAGDSIKKVKMLICEVQIVDFDLYINGSKKTDIIEYLNIYNFKLLKEEPQTFNQELNLYFINRNL